MTMVYIGPQDKASHVYGGKITSRNWVEYLIGGHIYWSRRKWRFLLKS